MIYLPDRIPWLRILVEGAVIVGSILLAFGIDAWWDEAQERRRLDEMLEAVAAEFESERVAMDSVVVENEHAINWYETTLRRTDPVLAQLSEDSIRTLGSQIWDYQIWEAGFGALAALLNGSLLEKVPDPELRRLLGGWEGELGDLLWTQQQVYDATQGITRVFISQGLALEVLDGRSPYVTRLRAMATNREARAAEMIVADALYAYTQDLYRVRERASEIAARIRTASEPDD